MYPSGDVREILYGTYNPLSEDCLREEFCAQQLTMTETVTPQFDPYYNIRYSHPETSRRVKYLKKLIHNAAIDYLKSQIQDLSDHNRKEIAYSLKVIKRDTISVLKRATEIIDEHNLSLSALDAKGISFAKDLPYYESIYIFNYIVATAIYVYMEFQEQFREYIMPEKLMATEDFYTIEMKVAVPKNLPIVKSDRQERIIEGPSTIDVQKVKSPIEEETDTFIETVKDFTFFDMPMVAKLTEEAKYRLAYLIVSNDAPYSIAMLYHIGYYSHLEKFYHFNKGQCHDHVSKLLNIERRTCIGNRNVLNPGSKDDKLKYTSWKLLDDVQKDYNNLPVTP